MKPSHKKPLSIKSFEDKWNQKGISLFTPSQPKIDKNEFPSAILHLSPHKTSGFDLCPMAGNCSKLCLHFSGAKFLHKTKFKARIRKSLMLNDDSKSFMHLVIFNICHLYKKKNIKNIRLNGTSDYDFLSEKISIDSALSSFIFQRYNIHLCVGNYENIFDLFLSNNIDLNFYDYSKIISIEKIKKSKLFKYDLTFSFDGWNNSENLKGCNLALNNGVRVAACFKNVKKDQPFKKEIRFLNHFLPIEDGDIHDERWKNSNYCLVGLRYKRVQSHKVKEEYINNFCIDTI